MIAINPEMLANADTVAKLVEVLRTELVKQFANENVSDETLAQFVTASIATVAHKRYTGQRQADILVGVYADLQNNPQTLISGISSNLVQNYITEYITDAARAREYAAYQRKIAAGACHKSDGTGKA